MGEFLTTALLAACMVMVVLIARAWWAGKRTVAEAAEAKFRVGDITEHSLRFYNGTDWSKPTLIAIEGKVYDVTKATDLYGPGKRLAGYAGREVARALALDSVAADDIDRGADLAGLDAAARERLAAAAKHAADAYDDVGAVVPLRLFSAAELAAGDGADPDPAARLYLSIKGVVYDITTGRTFYGPNGVYPFAGKEVARAFAMLSTDLVDCTDDLSGLSNLELDNLREWQDKFNWKYPVVGALAGSAAAVAAGLGGRKLGSK